MTDDTPRRSPLEAEHEAAGAKMVEFAGWRMPLRYSSVIEEHKGVRARAGLFDVSHMGEAMIVGTAAEAFLQRATPNDVSQLAPGQAHYTGLLTERGTYLDDLLIYRLAAEEFLLVVNASNTQGDLEHLRQLLSAEFSGEDVAIQETTDWVALMALQGPRAAEILEAAGANPTDDLPNYHCRWDQVADREVFLARTGYTGEDGFEIFVPSAEGPDVWRRLVAAGESHGLVLAGLGARDTLRTEAAMALYGHEIDDTTTPYEARLGWTIKLDKGPFVGRDALVEAKAQGPKRKLVGFEITGRGIAREGCPVLVEGEVAGQVTSGTFSPWLEKAIGMAFVPPGAAKVGRELEIEVRGRRLPAVQVKLPFYKRSRA